MKSGKQKNRLGPVMQQKNSGSSLIEQALQLHQAGQLQPAEALYRQLIQEQPKHQDAHNLLGFLLYQRGQKDLAIASINRAIAIDPNQPLYYNNLGIVIQNQGNLEEAIVCYNKALALNPAYHAAFSNLGTALQSLGKMEEALTCQEKALALNPDFFEAHSNMGNIHCDQGQFAQAIECYNKALKINPTYINALHNLAYVLQKQGKLEEALVLLDKALTIKPDYLTALNTKGNVFQDAGRLDQAIACYQKTLEFDPNYYEAISNMGNVLCDQGKLDESIACHQKALAIKPDLHESYTHMGNAFQLQGRMEEAIHSYQQALAIKPTDDTALENLGVAYNVHGNLEGSIDCYRQALIKKPDSPNAYASLINLLKQTCNWQELPSLFDRMMALFHNDSKMINPFVFLTLPTTASQQKECAQFYIEKKYRTRHQLAAQVHDGPNPARIKIGYLSCDFLNHATAILMAEIFKLHDRSRFEILIYSYSDNDGREMRQRIVETSDQFIDIVAIDHQNAAQRILADGVHILVELKGFTKGARLEISALSPAPIQVSWLGYPGTMGAEYIDYIFADPFIIPAGWESFYTEKVLRLPHCYQPNDRQRPYPQTIPARHEHGLPEQGMIFSNFNQTYKITPEMFDIWISLLLQVPDSILWLLESNTLVANNLRREAATRGLDPSRLYFAPKLPVSEHLARYHLVDLVLDTYPVASHTTASDALWVGCPLLTYVGETFVSRVAGSLLHSVGLPELVTDSLEAYAAMALSLAQNPTRLKAMRAHLQANRMTAPLFDTPLFTKNLEAAYEAIWQRFQLGLEPDHIDIPSQATTEPTPLGMHTIETMQPPLPPPTLQPVVEPTPTPPHVMQPVVEPLPTSLPPLPFMQPLAKPQPTTPRMITPPTLIMLTICIPNCNHPKQLADTLDHLQWTTQCGIAIEIIVADNASSDDIQQVAQEKGRQFSHFRSIRQTRPASRMQNHNALIRSARGRFCLTLAEDDRLIPDSVLAQIDFMQQHKEIIVNHAPWQLYNQATQMDQGLPYNLDEPITFGKMQSAELFNFLVNRFIFPEIAIYRTEFYHKILFECYHAHTPLIMDFRALEYGQVRFQPQPFYQYIIQPNQTKAGETAILPQLDQYRGGLELAASMAMANIGMTDFNPGNAAIVLNLINQYLVQRIRIAAQIAQSQRDYIRASELSKRCLLWEKEASQRAQIRLFAQEMMTGAVYQSMVEMVHSFPDGTQLVLCALSNPEVVQESFALLDPRISTVIRPLSIAVEALDRKNCLYFTETEEIRTALVASEVDMGRVVLVSDLIRIFQLL